MNSIMNYVSFRLPQVERSRVLVLGLVDNRCVSSAIGLLALHVEPTGHGLSQRSHSLVLIAS
eukprot:2021265-Amphidinium_carterae.1